MNIESMTWNECDFLADHLSGEITDAYKRSDYALIQELEMKRDLIHARIAEYKAEFELERAEMYRQSASEYRPMSAETVAKIDAFLREHKLRLNHGHGFSVVLAGYDFMVVPTDDEWAHNIVEHIPGWKGYLVAFNAQFGSGA